MEPWTVALVLLVALAASTLTLFSGFGLGTLLLPAFALVFRLEVAVAATAVVHLANNLWKGGLLWRDARWPIVGRFGVPALLAAFLGAALLVRLPTGALATYRLGGEHEVTVLGLVVGVLILAFGIMDLVPRLKRWNVSVHWLPLGGLLSGFFGGLSGHQGALRSVFLTKLGLAPAGFVATATFCAILVDVARLSVYGVAGVRPDAWPLVIAAMMMAFTGAFLGKRLLGKVTMESVRTVVGMLLVAIGGLLAAGVV